MQHTFTFDTLKRCIQACHGSIPTAFMLMTLKVLVQSIPLIQIKGDWWLRYRYVDLEIEVGLSVDQIRYNMRKLKNLHLIATHFERGNKNVMYVKLTDRARGILK